MSRISYWSVPTSAVPQRIQTFISAGGSIRLAAWRVAPLADVCRSLAGQGAALGGTSETNPPPSLPPGYDT
jgi:hypothetical protein